MVSFAVSLAILGFALPYLAWRSALEEADHASPVLPPVFWGCVWISLLVTALLVGLRARKTVFGRGLLTGQ